MCKQLFTNKYLKNDTVTSRMPDARSGGGFSTLEMLIAMSILTVVLTGVVLTSFGNQGMLRGGETNAEAMNKAQAMLEAAQLNARKDFRLVVSQATTTDGIYTKSVWVEPWPDDPYTTKRVSAFLVWQDDRGQKQSLTLTTLLTNFTNAMGGDTCASSLMGDWMNPSTSNYALAAGDLLPGSLPGSFTVGAVDAYKGKLYVAASQTSGNPSPTFFVFDIQNPPQKPMYVGSTDNAPGTSAGLKDIHVGNTVQDGGGVARTYAYAANTYAADFNSCTAGPNCAQLQVIDVTNAASPSVVFNFKFATSSASTPNPPPYVRGSGGNARGQALFYKDGYVYLGLAITESGPEFNIIDVHNPLAPVAIGAGLSIGRSIQSIFVRDHYAFIATDDTNKELMVVDIENPLAPKVITPTVYNPGGSNGGSRVYSIGDTLYLAKQYASGAPELYVLDITNPNASGVGLSTSVTPNTKEIGASVMGLIVRDYLGFLLTSTTNQLRVVDFRDLATPGATLALPGSGVSLDCEGNTLYAGTNSGANGSVSVISPAP